MKKNKKLIIRLILPLFACFFALFTSYSVNALSSLPSDAEELVGEGSAVFYANGGKFSDGSSQHTSNGISVFAYMFDDYVYGAYFNSFEFPTREGYTFKGWKTSMSATDYQSKDDDYLCYLFDTGVPTESAYFYAVWEENISSYNLTITLNGNGGTMDGVETYTITKTYTINSITLSSGEITNLCVKPTRNGYTFQGWYIGNTGSVESSFTIDLTTTTSVTFTAAWTKNKNYYDFTFNTNNGYFDNSRSSITTDYLTNVSSSVNYTQNELNSLVGVVPTREGYTFKGWSQDLNSSSVPETITFSFTSTTMHFHLYAVWEKQTFTITFDANGGTTSATDVVVEYGTTYVPTEIATLEDYTFKGWSLDSTSNVATNSFVVKSDIILHAVFVSADDPITYDVTITFDSYNFNMPNCNNTVFTGVYSTYECTLNINQEFINNTLLPYFNNAFYVEEVEGFTFKGWTLENGTLPLDNYIFDLNNTNEIYFYLYWCDDNVVFPIAHFNTNGGNDIESIEVDSNYEFINYGFTSCNMPIPTREGYKFVKWIYSRENSLVGNDFIKVVIGTEDIYFIAVWESTLFNGNFTFNNYFENGVDGVEQMSSFTANVIFTSNNTLFTSMSVEYGNEGWRVYYNDLLVAYCNSVTNNVINFSNENYCNIYFDNVVVENNDLYLFLKYNLRFGTTDLIDVKGYYFFNEVILFSSDYIAIDTLFISNGAVFNSVIYSNGSLYYDDILVYSTSNGWVDNKFRQVNFNPSALSDEEENFFVENGLFEYVNLYEDITLNDLLFSIADIPVRIMSQVLDVSIFGTSLFVAFCGIITVLLLVFVLKKFL